MRDYWYCPRCDGNFDHGESCDCGKEEANPPKQGQPHVKLTASSVATFNRKVKNERKCANA